VASRTFRRAARRAAARATAWRRTRRAKAARARREATDLTVRSITGTPRPARTVAARPTGMSAPMDQRVKRTKDGRFNGSTTGKKTAGKSVAKKTTKTAKAAATPEARKAAQTGRLLAAGDKRVGRVDKRTAAADQRLDKEFGHG
jgi:hypothetical protein